MHPLSSIGVFVAFVSVFGSVNSSVVKQFDGLNVTTEDVKVPNKKTVEAPAQPVNAPEKSIAAVLVKECVPIGQFCNSHSDCCSNSCLGYMKRCVSGSG